MTRHHCGELQTTKQLSEMKHLFEFTCSDFPRHFQVNRYNLVWINRQWKCKKGKG